MSINKGFTLIELLVVIGIVAILAVVVILTINPAELLRQARDSNRISDLSTLQSALSLYLADVTSPFMGTTTNCYVSAATSAASCAPAFTSGTAIATTSRSIAGTGWIPVNFNSIGAGSPLSNLPIDPVNSSSSGYFYAYKASGTVFEIVANMESTRYASGGGSDVEANSADGGNNATWYETGSDPGLDL